ncbi:hypothetical protein RQP46_011203 [Phenoliferia psychrophenolica]
MRPTVPIAFSLLALVPTILAAAPPCMIFCIGKHILNRSCAQSDGQCLCTNKGFLRDLSQCMEEKCDSDARTDSEAYFESYCLTVDSPIVFAA